MSWAVEVQQPAEKELLALPSQVRKRIARALRALKDNPFPHGVKKLKARDGYRIRVGDYRIFFRVAAAWHASPIAACIAKMQANQKNRVFFIQMKTG